MIFKELINIAKPSGSAEEMPVLFFGHGNPMNAIRDNEFVQGWKDVGKTLPKPVAILCLSAHWETRGTFVTAMQKPATIHDFGGFPEELFNVQYPAPGSPEFAAETKKIVSSADVGLDYNWGLDHGCWSVLKNLYPEAKIPVFQMSLNYNLTPDQHFELAKELSVLRRKGILIIGSGNMVHNLGAVAWDKLYGPAFGYDWALEAGDKMKSYIINGDFQNLIDFESQGRAFEMSIPTPEHYLPMLYVLALKDENESVTFFNDKTIAGSLSMTSIKIGGK